MNKKLLTLLSFLCALTSQFEALAATTRGFEIGTYGFIKASSIYADKAVASFNNINLSAPTHAPALTRSQDKTSRVSFQTQQSRICVALKKDQLTGKLEVDFIDFNKSSPTTQMGPRVRIASVTYQLHGQSKLIFGQDWDLYSPVTAYTFDIVGLYFMAGNTGFMRQQFQYLREMGSWEIGGALGMAGNNPNPTDQDLELSKTPTVSGRVSKKLSTGRVGLSGIYSSLNYATTNGRRHVSYAANAFHENSYGNLQLKSEAYFGQNVGNIGLLGIGRGTSSRDLREYGATATFSYKVSDRHVAFGGVGAALIDNKSALGPFALNPNGSIASAGVASNVLTRLGWEYKATPDFSWLTELSRFQTSSKSGENEYVLNIVPTLETGIILQF